MIPPMSQNNTTLVVRRSFNASRQRVFRAWTEPKALESWLKPGGLTIRVSSLDLRIGGSFRFELANGTAIFGTYLHIAPPEKLVFTWLGDAIQGQKTTVMLDFLDRGVGTEVVLTHEGLHTPDIYAMFESGWSSLLDTLDLKFFSPLKNG